MNNFVIVQKFIQYSIESVSYLPFKVGTALEQKQQQLDFCLGIIGFVESFVDKLDFFLDGFHCLLVV